MYVIQNIIECSWSIKSKDFPHLIKSLFNKFVIDMDFGCGYISMKKCIRLGMTFFILYIVVEVVQR